MELPLGEALDPTAPVDAVAEVATSPSSSAEAELIEWVLLWRSCEKCLAIPEEPDEKSFCVSLSWKDVVVGIEPVAALPV